MIYFIDESGNSGDLINAKNGLGFSGQPVFSLAAINTSSIEDIEEQVNVLKVKHRIQADELKSSKIYKDKPEFILDVFSKISELGAQYFVEVVDKRYYICTSIASHQIIPPYFTGDESSGNYQIMRNIAANAMAIDMEDSRFEKFFECCLNPSEHALLASMREIQSFFCSGPLEAFSEHIELAIEDYYDLKKINGTGAINKFIPIPDTNKKEKLVHLLPHISSLTNLIARINFLKKGNLEGVKFIHDKQDHFDIILESTRKLMLELRPMDHQPPTPRSDFAISPGASLDFSDSKKTCGIQLADLLAGFFNRYYYEFFNSSDISNVYHEIYRDISSSFSERTSIGVNWVVPPSKLYELESFHATGTRHTPNEQQLLNYIASSFNVAA